MEEKYFDVSSLSLNIKSFTLRQMTGKDEIAAEGRANGRSFAFTEELIAQSIVAVDGDRVPAPYIAWKEWPTRTRDFVRAAYRRMNSVEAGEVDDFLSEAFAEPDDVDKVSVNS